MIEPEKRKAIYLLSREGMSVREIARRLGVSRPEAWAVFREWGDLRGVSRKEEHGPERFDSDERGVEVQTVEIGGKPHVLLASSLPLRYSKSGYLPFYICFARSPMECFLRKVLGRWGQAARTCATDNTNAARRLATRTGAAAGGVSRFERVLLKDLEIVATAMQRIAAKSQDPKIPARAFCAQATLLLAGILSRVGAFAQAMRSLHDRTGKA
jgi:hypothetical protein